MRKPTLNQIKNLKPQIVHIQYDDYASIIPHIKSDANVIGITSHFGYLEQKNKLKKVETDEKSMIPILKKEYEDSISLKNNKQLELEKSIEYTEQLKKEYIENLRLLGHEVIVYGPSNCPTSNKHLYSVTNRLNPSNRICFPTFEMCYDLITNNYGDKIPIHAGIKDMNVPIITADHKFLMELLQRTKQFDPASTFLYVNDKRQFEPLETIVTLHGYLRILPTEICILMFMQIALSAV